MLTRFIARAKNFINVRCLAVGGIVRARAVRRDVLLAEMCYLGQQDLFSLMFGNRCWISKRTGDASAFTGLNFVKRIVAGHSFSTECLRLG